MEEPANQPIVGTEAVASGSLSRHTLRSKFVAIHQDIYVPRGAPVTAVTRAHAAALWRQRSGVLAGRSAAALLGAKWVDAAAPAEILHPNRRPPAGITTWSDRVAEDEVALVNGLRLTTPARTALDIACRRPIDQAVAEIDALARATELKIVDTELLAERYPGRRNIVRARSALDLVDAGSESPRETWLRLLLIRAGFPRPQTQIRVRNEYGVIVARVDMGWEELKVGVDYEGIHHRISARRFGEDIQRGETLLELDWIDVRVTSEDTEATIIRRVAAARARRT